jgi:hypothetical protein
VWLFTNTEGGAMNMDQFAREVIRTALQKSGSEGKGFHAGRCGLGTELRSLTGKPKDRQKKKRKPYEKPTATKLTPGQAKPELLAHAMKGDEGARESLDLIFPNAPSKDSAKPKKAS